MPKKYVGMEVFFPVRNPAYQYDHEYIVVVQPWGVFHAVKMVWDNVYNGKVSQLENSFQHCADDEYLNAEVKAQFLARNEISRTKWFWMATAIALVSLLVSLGLPEWIGFLVAVGAFAIRAYLTNHALGLSRKPVYKMKKNH